MANLSAFDCLSELRRPLGRIDLRQVRECMAIAMCGYAQLEAKLSVKNAVGAANIAAELERRLRSVARRVERPRLAKAAQAKARA